MFMSSVGFHLTATQLRHRQRALQEPKLFTPSCYRSFQIIALTYNLVSGAGISTVPFYSPPLVSSPRNLNSCQSQLSPEVTLTQQPSWGLGHLSVLS